jgi:2-phospho-L-lactate guanylyltransferase
MQGTVREFSEATRSGSIILDDGTDIPIPPAAFSRSGLLKLAVGQRVRFETEGEGADRVVRELNIVTLR